MFELSVACKYLLPRRRQLSVSIISLISIFVISLVVWLIVVFFSVTDGLEKNWVHKLIALTAPIRITPTDAYYNSYYYRIDSISNASDYTLKNISEKKEALESDPYDETLDEEIPSAWPLPDRGSDGKVKDLVQLAYQSIDEIKAVPGLKAQDFELSFSNIHLSLLREAAQPLQQYALGGVSKSVLSYPVYVGNFEGENPYLSQTLLPVNMHDIDNLLILMGVTASEETQEEERFFEPEVLHQRLNQFFEKVHVKALKTRSAGWTIPRHLWPEQALWKVCFVIKGDEILHIVVPQDKQHLKDLKEFLEGQGLTVKTGEVEIKNRTLWIDEQGEKTSLPGRLSLTLAPGTQLLAQLVPESIAQTKRVGELRFHIKFFIQGSPLEGVVYYRGLQIAEADLHEVSPLWVYKNENSYSLPKDEEVGDGVLLPKSFKEGGVLVGDRGYLTYLTPTASLLQEQHLPIYVAGFYDPGIIPIGGKFVLVNREISTLIRSAHQQDNHQVVTNGMNVHFDDLDQTDFVKSKLIEAFKQKGIDRYWKVESYREYEFTKDIMGELQSQKNIFTLIAIVIIIVACSNIISMLIILVNDKKTEIGILRSMGASSKSIALIFGLAGGVIGLLGSIIGIVSAILTLRYLDRLIGFISQLQGQNLFTTAFYGDMLPQELSYEALSFVIMATVVISLLAGLVPAIKACMLRPAHILRSSGA